MDSGGEWLKRLNTRLRYICETEGEEYGEDATEEKEVVQRFEKGVKLVYNNIREVMKNVSKAKTVDFCFLLDATGSMGWHIAGVKDSIKKIVNTLRRSRDGAGGIQKLRIAVVSYRDFDVTQSIEIFDFSEVPDACVGHCERIQTPIGSGGDTPEDVFGGLEALQKLSWSVDAGTRIVFHICDAPCHGNQFHDASMDDYYPNGDPKGRTAETLFSELRKIGVDYYFGKILASTDKMVDEFSKVYGKFITMFDVKDVTNIAGSVITSVTTSVTTNVEQARLGGAASAPQVKFDSKEPSWQAVTAQERSCIEFEKPQSIQDIVDDKPLARSNSSASVKVAPNPFAEGAERLVFYGQLTSPQACSVVLKQLKPGSKDYRVLFRYETAAEIQTIAAFLAEKFNVAAQVTSKIRFLSPVRVLAQPDSEAQQLPDHDRRYHICEARLDSSSQFFKFTDNLDFAMEQEQMVQQGVSQDLLDLVVAFSHWTWQATDKFLMVTDLQGCVQGSGSTQVAVMTDPAIHCLDTTRYPPTNLGKAGIDAFCKVHKCNSWCERLKLPVL